jgi:hypothetical protein
MSEVKPFSPLDEIIAADDTKYDTVEAYGKTVRIGSLSSADMIDFIEKQMDSKGAGRFAGIYLLVMSLVGPNGERVAKEERDATVEVFKNKHAASNRAVIRAARHLNGLDDLGKVLDALKNVSGEASTDASPTDSASK